MKNLLLHIAAILIGTFLLANSIQASVKTPINISPANGASGITSPYTFTWSLSKKGSDPDCFEVQISANEDFTNIIIDLPEIQTINTSIDLSSLTGGATYFWRVIATKNDKHSKDFWHAKAKGNDEHFNISVYTSFTLSLSPSLPVELNSFSGSVSGNVVVLKWITATEVNNYGFDVERKSENSDWMQIGFVAGSGNSNSAHNYSFTDQPSGGTSFSYRIKQIDNSGAFKYYDAITISIDQTNEAKLLQNSPNPFNPTTSIKFFVPQTMNVTIKIYNILGAEVTTLVNNQVASGYHIAYWNGRDNFGNSVASGIYLYRLQAGNFTETKKMNLLK